MSDRAKAAITVDAPSVAVVAVLADVEAYQDWVAAVRSVEVLRRDHRGRVLSARFVFDGGAIKDTYALNYSWEFDRTSIGLVRWELAEASSFFNELKGSYEVARVTPTKTAVTYCLQVDVRIPMPGFLKRKAERQITATALNELKLRIESGGQ
ncbi:MAG: SRPBCC family protein [Actinomycetota bacterium]